MGIENVTETLLLDYTERLNNIRQWCKIISQPGKDCGTHKLTDCVREGISKKRLGFFRVLGTPTTGLLYTIPVQLF